MAGFEKLGDDDWRSASAAAVHGGELYAVRDGRLWIVDLRDGGGRALGDQRWSSRWLLSAGAPGLRSLLSIEEDGALWRIDPAPGTRQRLAGDWRGTTAACAQGDHFWACAGGKLYRADPGSGAWQVLASSEPWRSRLLLSVGARIYSLEQGGTLFALDTTTGDYRAFQGDWSGCAAGAAANGRLQLLCAGLWNDVDPLDGRWTELDPGTVWRTRLAVPSPDGRGLLCFDADGSLYRFLF